jgi:hypothetical protein
MHKGNGIVAVAPLTAPAGTLAHNRQLASAATPPKPLPPVAPAGGKAEPIVSWHICVLSAIVLLIGASLGIGMIVLLSPQPKAVALVIDDDDAVERPTRVWPAPIARSEPAPECVDCNARSPP